MHIKVTVTQMHNEPQQFVNDWQQLVEHVRSEHSQLVLLPEMPFAPWFATSPDFDATLWQIIYQSHQRWLQRLPELAPAHVISSFPVNRIGRRLNEGFLWETDNGYQAVHEKYYLPDEEGVWEASWYQPGKGDFTLVASHDATIGMLICSELWALEYARIYGQQGAHLLVTPRMTQGSTTEKWLVGGRAAAILAGAFSLSSNRVSLPGSPEDYGGIGWIIDPDGNVLATTSRQHPFITVNLDLQQGEHAKKTYPRYMFYNR
jgi:N-carbamoylputrescine amidase